MLAEHSRPCSFFFTAFVLVLWIAKLLEGVVYAGCPQFLPSLFLFLSLYWFCHSDPSWAHPVQASNTVPTVKANACVSILVLFPPPSGSLPLSLSLEQLLVFLLSP